MNKFEDAVKRVTVNPVIRFLGRRIEKKNFSGEPIFITASPRSGTTLLLSMLGAHPNIFAIPEQTYAFDRWTKVKNRPYKYFPYRIDRMYRHFLFHGIDKTVRDFISVIQSTPLDRYNSLNRFIVFNRHTYVYS